MTVAQLPEYLKQHGLEIGDQLPKRNLQTETEAGAERSVEQRCEPMNENRIRGLRVAGGAATYVKWTRTSQLSNVLGTQPKARPWRPGSIFGTADLFTCGA